MEKYEILLCGQLNRQLDALVKQELKKINGGIMPSADSQRQHMVTRKYDQAKVPCTMVLWKDKKFLEHTNGNVKFIGGAKPTMVAIVDYEVFPI